jgi:hypothetical protein
MKIIITEKQDKEILSFIRRIGIADDVISKINPKDVCEYWIDNDKDALYFADDIIQDIVWRINETFGINSYSNEKLYKFFEDYGYYDKLIKIFHKSFELCEQ